MREHNISMPLCSHMHAYSAYLASNRYCSISLFLSPFSIICSFIIRVFACKLPQEQLHIVFFLFVCCRSFAPLFILLCVFFLLAATLFTIVSLDITILCVAVCILVHELRTTFVSSGSLITAIWFATAINSSVHRFRVVAVVFFFEWLAFLISILSMREYFLFLSEICHLSMWVFASIKIKNTVKNLNIQYRIGIHFSRPVYANRRNWLRMGNVTIQIVC